MRLEAWQEGVIVSMVSPRILLIDDHPLFCDAMAMTVEEIFDHPLVMTAGDLTGAVELLDKEAPFDLIVLDLNLPDVDGLDGMVRLQSLASESRIVVVSSLSDNHIIASVLAAGARGFIPKDSTRNELVDAFNCIVQEQIYSPPDFHQPNTTPLKADTQEVLKRLETLTPQQSKILTLICEGKLNKQIAYELSIVETTVKAHLTAILRKLGVQNRTQAVLLAKKISFTSLSKSD